jgi:hypothetical protein
MGVPGMPELPPDVRARVQAILRAAGGADCVPRIWRSPNSRPRGLRQLVPVLLPPVKQRHARPPIPLPGIRPQSSRRGEGVPVVSAGGGSGGTTWVPAEGGKRGTSVALHLRRRRWG